MKNNLQYTIVALYDFEHLNKYLAEHLPKGVFPVAVITDKNNELIQDVIREAPLEHPEVNICLICAFFTEIYKV